MAMELKVISTDDAYTHLALSGKLDILGVGEIENKFIGYTAARKKNALVDLSGVTFMGSMGLRIFLSAARSLSLEKKSLILLNPQPLVNEVLETPPASRMWLSSNTTPSRPWQSQGLDGSPEREGVRSTVRSLSCLIWSLHRNPNACAPPHRRGPSRQTFWKRPRRTRPSASIPPWAGSFSSTFWKSPPLLKSPRRGRILIVDHDRSAAKSWRGISSAKAMSSSSRKTAPRRWFAGGGEFRSGALGSAVAGLNGLDMLNRVRKDAAAAAHPVVLLSEQKDAEMVIRCIEAGADDYLPKPFNPALLKARIRACMERKDCATRSSGFWPDQGPSGANRGELAEATTYLTSLLPRRLRNRSPPTGASSRRANWAAIALAITGSMRTTLRSTCSMSAGTAWARRFFPSPSSTCFAPARSTAPISAIPGGPRAANRPFPMEQQNNRYFTLWYGVYQRSTRKLTYSSGGHPPALLFEPGQTAAKKLAARGMMVGAMPNSRYPSQSCEIPAGSRLFLFCDGAYEITLPDGRSTPSTNSPPCWPIARGCAGRSRRGRRANPSKLRGSELEDDLSLITIQF
jgi:sigma-B regulation protein RsbU (phosphoserine phosphatase)